MHGRWYLGARHAFGLQYLRSIPQCKAASERLEVRSARKHELPHGHNMAPRSPDHSTSLGRISEVDSISDEGLPSRDAKFIQILHFDFFYGQKQALFDIDMDIPEREITAFIGPSGCGKTTLLRSINRLSDLVKGSRHNGDIKLRGQSVFQIKPDVISLRKRIGMVFQKTNPFQKSIYENVVFGLRMAGQNNRNVLDEIVERSLCEAWLWDEVKDRLQKSAWSLSGGPDAAALYCASDRQSARSALDGRAMCSARSDSHGQN